MKKFLFFIICVMMPLFVMADSGVNYNDALHYTSNYIYSFDKYNSYLFFKDKLEYVYEDGVFSYNPNFTSGGLLSKTEYEISNRDGNTFLTNGLEYWTLTKSSSGRHFVLDYRLKEKEDVSGSGVRVTEYVKPNSIVSGMGSYADPWQFSEVLNLHLNSTNIIRGKVSTVPCSDTSMQKETVTLSFTSGSSVDAYICPASGYTVFTNSCSGYMTKDVNNRYVVSGVSKDNLICNIKFTYSTNTVTLGCNGCNTAPSPSTIYSNKVHDLWFNNKNGLDENIITKLSIVPAKTGYTFKGFYKDGTLVIDTDGTLKAGSTSAITSNVTIDGSFDANQYNVQLSIESPTSSDHTKSIIVTFDSYPESIIIPKRSYTVNYNANGGTTNKTQDIIVYNFDGYFYNSTQYIKSDGTAAKTWDVPNNVTLTGKWSGGTVSLPTATRPGYKLVGWYDASGNKIENGSQITKNLNLTAKWEAIDVNYKVKHYKENIDGSFASPEIETFTAKTATEVKPAVKTYTGFDSPTPQDAVVDGSGTTVIEYRYLRKKYTVSVGINNSSYGTLNNSSLTIKHGTTYSASSNVLSFNDGQKVTATVTNVTGYTTTFSSWSPSSGTITAATTITANFNRTPIKYTISFSSANSSYGTVSPTSLSVAYDSTYSVSGNVLTFSDGQKVTASTVSKTGYTTKFGSWSSTSGTVKGTASISASFSRTANTYTIAYNCNNGSGTISSTSHTYDSAKAITSSVCTRSGFDFAGWNTNSSGTGTSYSKGQSVTNLSSTQGATVTLYAKWNDVSNPSCKLKATASGVTFESKTDNVGVTAFGLIKSAIATYNSTSTLALSDGTFYGYVKDAAGNTGKCSITIGGTYVSSYTKTTQTCNRSAASYNKTVQTCTSSLNGYQKQSSTCNKYFSNYTKTLKMCKETLQSYTRTTKYCNRTISSYTRVSKTCNKSTTYSKAYKTCSKNSDGKYYWADSGTEYGVSSCTNVSNGTCTSAKLGKQNITCSTLATSYGWGGSSTTYPSSCSASSISCGSGTVGKSNVTCSANYSYSFGSSSSTTESSCSSNTFSCNSSNYGSTYVSCSGNYTYAYTTSTTTGSSCSTESLPGCNAVYVGNSYVTGCSANYTYGLGTSVMDVVAVCKANTFTCNASTVGSTYVTCHPQYKYSFTSSTLNNQSSCSTSGSFSCSSSTEGQTYVSGCSTNYSYAFGSSNSTVSSCSTTGSFTCNSGNHGSSYVSACTPAAYACSGSGYTKINNSYCYKY